MFGQGTSKYVNLALNNMLIYCVCTCNNSVLNEDDVSWRAVRIKLGSYEVFLVFKKNLPSENK